MRTPWWRNAVLYQIYPLSFADSNKDGYGDLVGIIDHINYLEWLGVGAIWLSPIYASPMADWGYDVSDFLSIDKIFGTMSDFDRLVKELHDRDIKIILDFVPNHTSIQHAWFKESASSTINPKRDWYIWADPRPDGGPPNNWLSYFGGSAWELSDNTGQYYLHSFLKEQPDLNWRNTEVQKAMIDVMKYWLSCGVDGFRTDAVYSLIKDLDLRDDPANPNYIPGVSDPSEKYLRINSTGQSDMYKILNTFCNVLSEGEGRFLLSEPPFSPYLSLPGLERLYDACIDHPLHAPFNFNLMTLPWSADAYKSFIDEYDSILNADDLPNYVLGNHDRSRLVSRIGESKARMLSFLQLTLRGLPVIYYGDELGMKDAVIKDENEKDPWGKQSPGFDFGRDKARSPMPWLSKQYGGFSDHEPWQPMSPGSDKINVSLEIENHHSLLNMCRELIRLREVYPALTEGGYKSVSCSNDEIFGFTRISAKETFLIILNFSNKPEQFEFAYPPKRLLCSTHARKGQATLSKELAPLEGRLYIIDGEEIKV